MQTVRERIQKIIWKEKRPFILFAEPVGLRLLASAAEMLRSSDTTNETRNKMDGINIKISQVGVLKENIFSSGPKFSLDVNCLFANCLKI